MIAIFPEIAQAAAAGDVERLAILVRRYFGGSDTFVARPSLSAILTAAGVPLSRMQLEEMGALLAKDERGRFRVALVIRSGAESITERFLLAHMLGHYLLDIQPLIARGDLQVSGYRETQCPQRRYSAEGTAKGSANTGPKSPSPEAREVRADAFAAALLMPRGMVKRAFAQLQDEAKTAAFFGVSRACLQRRLQEIGILSSAPSNFLDAERQIGGDLPGAADGAEVHGAGPTDVRALTPPADGSMPRSYAASTYGAMEKATRQGAPTKAPGRPSGAALGLPPSAPSEAATGAPLKSAPSPSSRLGGAAASLPQPAAPSLEAPRPVTKASAPTPQVSAPAEAPAAGAGMARLRELARKLDKGGLRTKNDTK